MAVSVRFYISLQLGEKLFKVTETNPKSLCSCEESLITGRRKYYFQESYLFPEDMGHFPVVLQGHGDEILSVSLKSSFVNQPKRLAGMYILRANAARAILELSTKNPKVMNMAIEGRKYRDVVELYLSIRKGEAKPEETYDWSKDMIIL